jgi:hypothetical protein
MKLLNSHPKTKELIRKWLEKKMKDSLDDDVEEDFKEYMLKTGIPDERTAAIIDIQPRVLFDIFDKNEVFIDIRHFLPLTFDNPDLSVKWKNQVNDNYNIFCYNTRKEAEDSAIQEAFDILENKLNTKD